jgi:hypothetical protein
MNDTEFGKMTVHQLVEQFTLVTLNQFQAERRTEFGKYNELYKKMTAIEQELKSRPGDQRAALIPLLSHPNPQVRLMAAQWTLAVAPSAARQALQELWDRREFPQAADAMGTMQALERGDRKPT